ncbi:hypothetical protein GWK47_004147 [Chionoecetes opilio]|uniref:Ig-like domain-containing protein n=1 Tax=Chionoecetes opilio TaxID=41210 RepID=A0A8J5D332_CHIOP|nr:hypothetical protein GWK47_004147 [Chionoecetes opilio]
MDCATKRGHARPNEPKEIVSAQVFGSRAQYQFMDGYAYLKVVDLQIEDAGHYTCRMDIRGIDTIGHSTSIYTRSSWSPSPLTVVRMRQFSPHWSNLVLVAGSARPSNPTIIGEDGREVFNNLGPYNEDATINVTCQVEGVKPLTVEITRPTYSLVVGKEYNITCESRDGLPPARITWWLLGKKMNADQIFTDTQGNVSRSILRLRPEIEHAKEKLQCHAESPKIAHPPLIDTWVLNVQ